jgi:hypothetical protein
MHWQVRIGRELCKPLGRIEERLLQHIGRIEPTLEPAVHA